MDVTHGVDLYSHICWNYIDFMDVTHGADLYSHIAETASVSSASLPGHAPHQPLLANVCSTNVL